ncbi:hypothetical protein E3N88_01412 [Mikania micrantha]|uniref:Uncharacterized protein n=1 Tax=Mikania micrantha TaxID=192012 RepID=A0A5N6Q2H3_9ASTR|nr:hypothetical protein E3N88_01412 [Mikania micrantha]
MEEEFDVSAFSAINALRRATLKERSVREEERRQIQAKIQAHAQVLRAAFTFQASGNDTDALKNKIKNDYKEERE